MSKKIINKELLAARRTMRGLVVALILGPISWIPVLLAGNALFRLLRHKF